MKQTFAHPHDDEQRQHVAVKRPEPPRPRSVVCRRVTDSRTTNDEVTRRAPPPRSAGNAPRAARYLSSVSTSKAYSAEVSTNTSFTGIGIGEIRVMVLRDIGGVIFGAE